MAITSKLTDTEKNLFLFSLPIVNKDLENFVNRFYSHFLQTPAKKLFQNSNMERQHKMFSTAINVILTQASDPSSTDAYLQNIVKTHAYYGNMSDYIEPFIDSFMEALRETLKEQSNVQILKTWNKVLNEIMSYFH